MSPSSLTDGPQKSSNIRPVPGSGLRSGFMFSIMQTASITSFTRLGGFYTHGHMHRISEQSCTTEHVELNAKADTSITYMVLNWTWRKSLDILQCQKVNMKRGTFMAWTWVMHAGLGKGRNITCAMWQVTLCHPIWHVSSRSSKACCKPLYPVTLPSWHELWWCRLAWEYQVVSWCWGLRLHLRGPVHWYYYNPFNGSLASTRRYILPSSGFSGAKWI